MAEDVLAALGSKERTAEQNVVDGVMFMGPSKAIVVLFVTTWAGRIVAGVRAKVGRIIRVEAVSCGKQYGGREKATAASGEHASNERRGFGSIRWLA